MTLLITVSAAVISTVVWYACEDRKQWKLGMLPMMYWGASLMWMVDAVAEYTELRTAYFTPAWEDMLNDAFLGISAVVFALTVWVIRLLAADPKGVIKEMLFRTVGNG